MKTTTPASAGIPAALPSGRDVGRALACRVAAVRAALETLARELPASGAPAGRIAGALQLVELLARDLDVWTAWAVPQDFTLLDTTPDEIGADAVRGLPPSQRERTLLATERPTSALRTDPTLVARALTHLIGDGLERGAQHAGLEAGATADGTTFTITFAGGAESARGPGLPGTLARRDLARLGACVCEDEDDRIRVLLPAGDERA